MENKLGNLMNQDELFKETHIVKKKKETDQERWVEGRASTVHLKWRNSYAVSHLMSRASQSNLRTRMLKECGRRLQAVQNGGRYTSFLLRNSIVISVECKE